MGKEIERKFLVIGDDWRAVAEEGTACRQGYLPGEADGITVRIRRIGEQGFITLKGKL